MKTYWYIKHNDLGAIRVVGDYTYGHWDGQEVKIPSCGYTCGEWQGYRHGIHDITCYPQKQHALEALKGLRFMKTKKEQRKFKLVKVSVKSK